MPQPNSLHLSFSEFVKKHVQKSQFDALKELTEKKQYQAAIDKYTEYLDINNDKACWHYYGGIAFFCTHHLSLAFCCWEKAVKIKPLIIPYQIKSQKIVLDTKLNQYKINNGDFRITIYNPDPLNHTFWGDRYYDLVPIGKRINIKLFGDNKIYCGKRLDQQTITYQYEDENGHINTKFLDIRPTLNVEAKQISFHTKNQYFGGTKTPQINDTIYMENKYYVIARNTNDAALNEKLSSDIHHDIHNILRVMNKRDAHKLVNANIGYIEDWIATNVQPGINENKYIKFAIQTGKIRIYAKFFCNSCEWFWPSNYIWKKIKIPDNFRVNCLEDLKQFVCITELNTHQRCKKCRQQYGTVTYWALFDEINENHKTGPHVNELCEGCKHGLCGPPKNHQYDDKRFKTALSMIQKMYPNYRIKMQSINCTTIIYVE